MSSVEEVCVRRCTFASFKVSWTIERFCLAVRTNIFKTESPPFVFHAEEQTSWVMRLDMMQSTGEDGKVEFVLGRRSAQSSSSDVTLNFEVAVTAGEIKSPVVDTEYTFRGNSEKTIKLTTVADILQRLTPLDDDTVLIECYIAFHLKDTSINFDPPSYGVKRLSEDLMSLKNSNKFLDVTVCVNDQDIKAHKAILCRNQKFKDLFKNDQLVVSLPDLKFNAVSAFLNLIYSGNIDFVFDYASVRILKCLDYFDCDILKYYRGIEELSVRTRYNEEPHEFHWVIANFDTKQTDDEITSPEIRRLTVNLVWQLKVIVKETAVSIFAEIISGEQPPLYCLEFGVKKSDLIINCKRVMGNNKNYDKMGFDVFAEKEDMMTNMLSEDGNLYIIFKVRTSDGTSNKTVLHRSVSCATPTSEPAYEDLSFQMRNLLIDEESCDIKLYVEGETFNAHKCILFARSTAFAKELVPSENNVTPNELTVLNIIPETFKIILEYIYSGVLKDYETRLLLQLYVASKLLGIDSLTKESCDQLHDKDVDVNKVDYETAAEIGGGHLAKVIDDLSNLTLQKR